MYYTVVLKGECRKVCPTKHSIFWLHMVAVVMHWLPHTHQTPHTHMSGAPTISPQFTHILQHKLYIWTTTRRIPHVFLDHSSYERGVQEPVVHTLVPECDTVNVFSSVHVPSPQTDSQLLRDSVLTPSLQHCLLEVQRSCGRETNNILKQVIPSWNGLTSTLT